MPKSGISIIMVVLLVIIFIILIFTGYYFVASCVQKKTFWDYMTDLQISPCLDDTATPAEEAAAAKADYSERKRERDKEVFHISDQVYTYEQARCKCNSYGAQLATYDQIINAYNEGANWCSYGWSEGQQAYYPTQPSAFYKRLATDPREWYACGDKPGVMGGYFPPNVQFGANCFGIKPAGDLAVPKETPPPTTAQVCAVVGDYDSNHRLRSDEISPFNQNQWSVYG